MPALPPSNRRPRFRPPGGKLFPHRLDKRIAQMPHDQRFEVTWHAPLGPWGKAGIHGRQHPDVIERHIDLQGAVLTRLLELRAITPTDKPAYKNPQTHANLALRAQLAPRNAGALQESGLILPPSATAPIAGVMNPANPTTVIIPGAK